MADYGHSVIERLASVLEGAERVVVGARAGVGGDGVNVLLRFGDENVDSRLDMLRLDLIEGILNLISRRGFVEVAAIRVSNGQSSKGSGF